MIIVHNQQNGVTWNMIKQVTFAYYSKPFIISFTQQNILQDSKNTKISKWSFASTAQTQITDFGLHTSLALLPRILSHVRDSCHYSMATESCVNLRDYDISDTPPVCLYCVYVYALLFVFKCQGCKPTVELASLWSRLLIIHEV